MHEAKASIFVDWRLMLRGRIAVNLYPAIIAVALPRVVLILFHPNLTHQRIMHIKEAVGFQQHLGDWGLPDATAVVLKTAAGSCRR
jgi:hypothetical protein